MPIKCTYIFNLAVNFLSKICGTDIVLCTATQPPLHELSYNVKGAKDIVHNVKKLECRATAHLTDDVFKNEDEFTDFIKDKIGLNCLVIVNTKKCALKIYKKLRCEFRNYKVYYLTTNMCAHHRKDVLEHVKEKLLNGEKVICVSTQLIEAGVDISFRTVVRSMCGIDSIIQSCGRCNRNYELSPKKGDLYIVRFSKEFENIDSLEDIKLGKIKSEYIFRAFGSEIEKNSEFIFSDKVIKKYYSEYFYSRENEMSYPISELHSSILELLSINTNDCRNEFTRNGKLQPLMMQAPKTAGEKFEVITDGEKEDFMVYYGKSKDLIAELYSEKSISEKMNIIKNLQSYTVSLYKNEYKNLDFDRCSLDKKCEDCYVNILSAKNYSEEFGVSSEESTNEFLSI